MRAPCQKPPSLTGRSLTLEQIEAASYIAALSADLASIARKHDLEVLDYILEMARSEAEILLAQRHAEL